jgi:hypothetical protein
MTFIEAVRLALATDTIHIANEHVVQVIMPMMMSTDASFQSVKHS